MVESTLTSTPGQDSWKVQEASACWSKVRESTTTSPAYCSDAVPAYGTGYCAPWRTAHVVVRRSTSRVTVQVMPSASSPDDSPGTNVGAGRSLPSHTGS